MRFCYLAGRMREYSKIVCQDLCALYKEFPEEEILISICKLLMLGQVTEHDAFSWYELGIEHNLKLTDLYEYYMYSIDENRKVEFKDSTLLYFLYDNHLTVAKKAMLYAYVVQNKKRMNETYQSYCSVMEEFTLWQLASGRISNNLAILYEEFIQEEWINEHTVSCQGRNLSHFKMEGRLSVFLQNITGFFWQISWITGMHRLLIIRQTNCFN